MPRDRKSPNKNMKKAEHGLNSTQLKTENSDQRVQMEELVEVPHLSRTLTTSSTVDHSQLTSDRLVRLFNCPDLSDVQLHVGASTYYAHRLLLANASQVFREMLTSSNWAEGNKKELELVEMEPCVAVFEEFLKYIYTGTVILTQESLMGLLILADKYDFPALKASCEEYMICHLACKHHNRAISWHQCARACSISSLETACLNYIKLNLDTVTDSMEWCDLQESLLIEILASSNIIVKNERMLLGAVCWWLNHESRVEQLQENLTKFLPLIRFPMIIPEDLIQFEQNAFFVDHKDVFTPYVLAAYRYHALPDGERVKLKNFPELPEAQFEYRNYTDSRYSISTELRAVPTGEFSAQLGLPLRSRADEMDQNCCLLDICYSPRGCNPAKTSVVQSPYTYVTPAIIIDAGIKIRHMEGRLVEEAKLSFVLHAKDGEERYSSYQSNATITGPSLASPLFIRHDINPDERMHSQSPYLIAGYLNCTLFIRPVKFQSAKILGSDMTRRSQPSSGSISLEQLFGR